MLVACFGPDFWVMNATYSTDVSQKGKGSLVKRPRPGVSWAANLPFIAFKKPHF